MEAPGALAGKVPLLEHGLGQLGRPGVGKCLKEYCHDIKLELNYKGREKGGPKYTFFELLLRQYSNFEENMY